MPDLCELFIHEEGNMVKPQQAQLYTNPDKHFQHQSMAFNFKQTQTILQEK